MEGTIIQFAAKQRENEQVMKPISSIKTIIIIKMIKNFARSMAVINIQRWNVMH